MQPFDYRLAVQNPVAMALQGYQQGQQFQNQRVQAERDTQLYDMQMQQFGMQQEELARQQARAQEVQSVLAGVAGRIGTGEVTAEEIAQIGLQFPEISEQVNASFDKLTEAQKQGQIKELSRFAVALSRSPEVAMGLIDQRIAAAEEAGDVEQVDQLKAMKSMAEMDPTAPLTAVMLQLGTVMDPEQFKTFYEVAMPKSPEAASAEGKVLQDYQNGFFGEPGTPEALAAAREALENQKRVPLIGQIGFGDTLRTGPLAAETALMEDASAPGGVRIVPIEGGTAATQKENAIATADDVIKTLQELKAAPGARNRYGLASIGGFVPPVPGSEEANAQALIKKVTGAAFLQAFESLKGGGQITQIEGDKATQAITVLQDQNISYDFAMKAVDDLIAIVEAGKARKARGETVAPATTPGTPTRRRFDAQGREIK